MATFEQFLDMSLRGVQCSCRTMAEWVKWYVDAVIEQAARETRLANLKAGKEVDVLARWDIVNPFDTINVDEENDPHDCDCPWSNALSTATWEWDQYERAWLIRRSCRRSGKVLPHDDKFIELVTRRTRLIRKTHRPSKDSVLLGTYEAWVLSDDAIAKARTIRLRLIRERRAEQQRFEAYRQQCRQQAAALIATLPPEVIERNRPGRKPVVVIR